MPVEKIADGQGGFIVTGNEINSFRLLALKGALHLECLGMKRSGRSAYNIVRSEFGLKGNKHSVYNQFVMRLTAWGVLKEIPHYPIGSNYTFPEA